MTRAGPPFVVMGVSGSGKSTFGAALARRLQVAFADADHLHPPANIDKMANGEPLTDHDRDPWLERVGQWLSEHRDGGVMSCSALKRGYRDRLRGHCPHARFLHLHGTPELIGQRVAARTGHFMPAALLRSQFDTLEPLAPDEHGVVIDLGGLVDVDAVVRACLSLFGPVRASARTASACDDDRSGR